MIKVFRTGRHIRRTLFSYAALQPMLSPHFQLVEHPAEADLYVIAHPGDLQDAPLEMIEDWRARRRPVVLLSEEPFWDTIWGKVPLDRHIFLDTRYGAVPVVQVTHTTSRIYEFDRIPYYLLTNGRFAASYARMFRRNAARPPADWRAEMAARPFDLTFMFERRPEPFHDVHWPEADLIGLCAWRTRLAEAADMGRVQRLGQSWQGGQSRFEIAGDWHADKLARLDGQTRLMGALENTHQPHYITEKLFDAFAIGAVPVYHASPGNRVHTFGLPPRAWINTFGMTPEAAAALLDPDAWQTRVEALVEAQRTLARLFGTPSHWTGERRRLARALAAEMHHILDTHRA